MTVLEPLARRYVFGSPSGPEPAEVWAMPVVLRMEKAEPPARTPLLEAAAAAALAVCLAGEPEWQEPLETWISARIRKVSRRARGAHWAAVQELPGVTVTVDGASARALVPCRVVDNPHEVARLQISGSELPADSPGPAPAGVPVLWLTPDAPMTVGKAAAQVGHATMLLASVLSAGQLSAWAATGFRCAVREAEPVTWKELLPGEDPAGAWRTQRVVAVRDAGFTEVAPGTVTVIAQWT